MVRYFRHMSMKNLIEYKRLNARFKRRLKIERTKSWKRWAESLSPNTPLKDIFRKFKQLSNYRVPNQPNTMFQNPEMTESFLKKLCKTHSPQPTVETSSSNTEEPFTIEELDFVLSQKTDSAPGIDGIQYGNVSKFPERVKNKFLELLNELWASQQTPEALKRILMVLIPKPGRDPQLMNSHRPIALLSFYLKIINSMIKVRLEKLVGDRQLLDEKSYGFVKHRSAINCVNHQRKNI